MLDINPHPHVSSKTTTKVLKRIESDRPIIQTYETKVVPRGVYQGGF
jgi:hypothetical protein